MCDDCIFPFTTSHFLCSLFKLSQFCILPSVPQICTHAASLSTCDRCVVIMHSFQFLHQIGGGHCKRKWASLERVHYLATDITVYTVCPSTQYTVCMLLLSHLTVIEDCPNRPCVKLLPRWQRYHIWWWGKNFFVCMWLTMSQQSSIGPFDASVEDWTSYEERFRLYNEITDDDKKQATSYWPHVPPPLTLYFEACMAALKKPSEISIAELLKLAAAHYHPKPSLAVQRFCFNSRTRQPEESVAAYYYYFYYYFFTKHTTITIEK